MEDDIVTAPGFLKFMNAGLDFYKNNKKIITIGGYNVPVKFPKSYKYDYYLSRYFNGWGFATWDNRDILRTLNYNDAHNELMRDKKLYKKIKKMYPELIAELKRIQEGTLDAGDYKIVFHSMKNDLYSVKPLHSLVNNTGCDGSGTHCKATTKFTNKTLGNKEVLFSDSIAPNTKIEKIWHHYLYNKTTIYNLPKKICSKLKKLLEN